MSNFFNKAKGNAVKGIGSQSAIGVGGGNVPQSGYYEGVVVGGSKAKNGSMWLDVLHNGMDRPSRTPFFNDPRNTANGAKPQYAERDADKLGALVVMLGVADEVEAILVKRKVNFDDPIAVGGAIIDLLCEDKFFKTGPGAGAKVTIQWRYAPNGAVQAKKPTERQWSEIVAVLPIDQLDDLRTNGPVVEDFPLPTIGHRAVSDGDDAPRGDYSGYTGRAPTNGATGGGSQAEDEDIPF
jgi:hypothetical protein